MKKILKARKGGFTLVELLIVIIIIAILAGMMLLTTGAATDGAEASKLINNLRAMKSAALLHFIDNNMTWIPNTASDTDIVNALSRYMDRSIDTIKYKPDIISGNIGGDERVLIGFNGGSIWTDKPGMKAKLKNMAKEAGLYQDNAGTEYAGTADAVYMNLR